jgi:hypothetical protein
VPRRTEALGHDDLGLARVEEIPWSHPRLERLGHAARLVYACLVDGCSSGARETLESIDVVWKRRYKLDGEAFELREAFVEICIAVEELVSAGLLVMLDRSSILDGWVMRPWESEPS